MSDEPFFQIRPPLLDEATSRARAVLEKWRSAGHLNCPSDSEFPLAVLVRDANGRCGVVLGSDALDDSALNVLRQELRDALGPHALPGNGVALRPEDHLTAHSILTDPGLVHMGEDRAFQMLDRLQTNLEWLKEPLRVEPVVPLGVGYSIKGGVGRSTALAVLAFALAREGKQVVVVDLDLESPGMGSLLLADEDQPKRGVIDWLSEALIGRPDFLFDDLLAPATAGQFFEKFGKLWVIPAAGVKTREYVAKLGRVYMPTHDPGSGKMHRLAKRLDQLLEVIRERLEPDLVLLDARAGLHDMGAAVVTQLGALVFLFGRDEPQSWKSLEHLLHHLQHSRQVGTADENRDLRLRLKMVAAMMEDFGTSLRLWKERSYDVWTNLYDDKDGSSYAFSPEDDCAPHEPLVIGSTTYVRRLAWQGKEIVEQWDLVMPFFQRFVDGARELLFIPGMSEDED